MAPIMRLAVALLLVAAAAHAAPDPSTWSAGDVVDATATTDVCEQVSAHSAKLAALMDEVEANPTKHKCAVGKEEKKEEKEEATPDHRRRGGMWHHCRPVVYTSTVTVSAPVVSTATVTVGPTRVAPPSDANRRHLLGAADLDPVA